MLIAQRSLISSNCTRYRSVKYRAVNSNLSLQKVKPKVQTASSISLPKTPSTKLQKIIANNIYQSNKSVNEFNYESNKKKSFSFMQRSKIDDKLNMRTAVTKQVNPQSQQNTDNDKDSFQKFTYLQSFEDLMSMQQNIKNNKKCKNSQIILKVSRQKERFKADRINLPNIIEYENSKFTALDPINLPIQYIEGQITKFNLKIAELPEPFKKMREQMYFLKTNLVKDIDSFQNGYLQELKSIRRKISLDLVYQQEYLLKCKRELIELEQFHPDFQAQILKSHERQITLQQTIFETRPFELQVNSQNTNYQQTISTIKKQIQYF